MRFFEYGSAYDDDAANEGRPAQEIKTGGWRYLALTHGTRRPLGELATLAYIRFSPQSESRQILLLLNKHRYGSIDFDLCGRCRRVHIWHLGVLASMHGLGFESKMLRMVRAKAPDDYRWTRSGLASCIQEFWDLIPPELRGRPEVPCEHLDWRPGRIRDAWACLRYWRLTGKLYWPESRARQSAVLGSKASRIGAPERLQAQLDQARQEFAEAELRAAKAARDRLPSEVRRARTARKNAAARIEWIHKRINELDG